MVAVDGPMVTGQEWSPPIAPSGAGRRSDDQGGGSEQLRIPKANGSAVPSDEASQQFCRRSISCRSAGRSLAAGRGPLLPKQSYRALLVSASRRCTRGQAGKRESLAQAVGCPLVTAPGSSSGVQKASR
jgi:hypothetical protein